MSSEESNYDKIKPRVEKICDKISAKIEVNSIDNIIFLIIFEKTHIDISSCFFTHFMNNMDTDSNFDRSIQNLLKDESELSFIDAYYSKPISTVELTESEIQEIDRNLKGDSEIDRG